MNLRPLDPMVLAQHSRPAGGGIGRWIIAYSALVALLLSSYLSLLKLSGKISDLAGCTGEGGCSQVLGGRWANWLLVPISVWALGVYLPLFALAVTGLTTAWRRRLVLVASGILIAAACWFMVVQLVIERQFCPYCFALHLCGVLAFGGALAVIASHGHEEAWRGLMWTATCSAAACVLLIAGQVWGPQPASHEITQQDLTGFVPADEQSTIVLADSPPPADDGGSTPWNASTSGETSQAAADTAAPTDAAAPSDVHGVVSDVDTGLPGDTAAGPASDSEPNVLSANGPVEAHVPAGRAGEREEPQADARVVEYFDGALRYRVGEFPLIGSPRATHVLVKYFDYTCNACQRMHEDLEAILQRYPDQVAVLVIPAPLDHACNPHVPEHLATGRNPHQDACELARIALAVWRTQPDAFPRFHQELFALQGRVDRDRALRLAITMAGDGVQTRLDSDPWIDQTLRHAISVYGRLSAKNPRMPKLLLKDRKILHGVVIDAGKFEQLLQQQLPLTQPADTVSIR